MTIEVSEQTYALLNKHFIGDSFYKQLFEELPIGYAFFKIIYDEEGNPCDYEFKDANSIFEEKTGLKRDAILCRRISEAVYSLDKNEIDKLNYNVKKTVIEGKQEFELYYRIINKWYRINLYSPKESYLIMYFIDITNEKNQLLELEHSRRRMKNIIEGTNVGTWELNLQTGERKCWAIP